MVCSCVCSLGMQSMRGSQAVQQSVMLMHKIMNYLSVNPHA